MPKPDGADAGGRDKDAEFAQFVAGPHLTMYREIDGKSHDRQLRGFFNSILQVGLAPVDFKKCFHAALVSGGLIPVKRIA